MDSYPMIKRFALIIERLKGQPAPSLKELKDFLEQEGFAVTTRTIQRDFDRLRDDFGLEIVLNKGQTYSIANVDDSQKFETLMRIIGLAQTSELLLQSVKDREESLSLLSFQHAANGYAGLQHFERLYAAIKDCRVVTIEHENFGKNKTSTHELKPLLLKEYSNRWYLVAMFTDSGALATFGLDRIQKVTVEKEKFKPQERKKASDLFDNVIGLVHDMHPPVTVRLAVSSGLAKYFKSVPLHHSQQEEAETSEEVIFSYFLSPNRELQRLILGYGSQVKVLSPKEFVKQVEQELRDMLKKYKTTNL